MNNDEYKAAIKLSFDLENLFKLYDDYRREKYEATGDMEVANLANFKTWILEAAK